MTVKEHLAVHDRQIAAIRTVIKEGMELVRAERKERVAMRQDMRRTERNLSRLIESLGQQRNGKHQGGR